MKLLTIKEASEMLRVSYQTVWRWLNSGKLEGFKVESTWRIKESDIEDRFKN